MRAYIIVYGGGIMVILKKIIILTEYEGSGVSGIVKFENFAGRTSCFVRVLGIKDKAEVSAPPLLPLLRPMYAAFMRQKA